MFALIDHFVAFLRTLYDYYYDTAWKHSTRRWNANAFSA